MSGKKRASARLAAFCGAAVVLAVDGAGPVEAGGRVLAPSDTVAIRILAAPDLDLTARIEPDGTIAFPYLGRTKAAGLTADTLARRIEQGLIARKILAGP